jgi:predicted dehydrogenase
MELANHLRASSNAEIVAFADIYAKHLDRAVASTPSAAAYKDHRALLDSQDIDAVVIATPQHLHSAHFIDALGAGKHVYLEKAAAFTVAEAKQMRSAYRASTRVVQIGHQACSSGHAADVQQFLNDPQRLGKITAIAMHMHRNTPLGKPQWSRPAMFTPELRASALDWAAFDAGREFDPNRFVHWRYFWDYSGGTVFEHMSQQLSFWYKTLNLNIPRSATMKGGVYLWKDGREVPDTVNVTLDQPEEMMVSWVSGLGNNQLGVSEEVLGTHGTISRAAQVRYTPQKVNSPGLREFTGRSAHTPQAHMQDFLDAIRLDREPSCPFELGYRVSIACRMAIESYRQDRTVRWDARREDIV